MSWKYIYSNCDRPSLHSNGKFRNLPFSIAPRSRNSPYSTWEWKEQICQSAQSQLGELVHHSSTYGHTSIISVTTCIHLLLSHLSLVNPLLASLFSIRCILPCQQSAPQCVNTIYTCYTSHIMRFHSPYELCTLSAYTAWASTNNRIYWISPWPTWQFTGACDVFNLLYIYVLTQLRIFKTHFNIIFTLMVQLFFAPTDVSHHLAFEHHSSFPLITLTSRNHAIIECISRPPASISSKRNILILSYNLRCLSRKNIYHRDSPKSNIRPTPWLHIKSCYNCINLIIAITEFNTFHQSIRPHFSLVIITKIMSQKIFYNIQLLLNIRFHSHVT